MKYDNVKCPVCDETFTSDSDVVVCPDCGTPHHRECYEKLSRCVNYGRHDEKFVWVSPLKPTDSTKEKDKNFDSPKVISGGVVTVNNAPNGAIPAIEVDQHGNQRPVYRAISAKEKIGEFTVEDYGKVVQKNIHKYIPKFLVMDKANRKVSVNWAAFFFGPYWLFYRKMYKYALVSLFILSFLPLVFMGEVISYGEEYMASYNEFVEIMMADASLTDTELTAMTEEILESMPVEPTALVVSSYLEFAVSLVLGLFGNYLYKRHCEKTLTKLKPLKEKSGDWDNAVKKVGGRSVMAIVFGFVIYLLAIFAVSAIYVYTGTDLATILRGLMNG